MSEQILQNPICPNCKADIRRGALFCYSCGETLAPAVTVETQEPENGQTTDLKTVVEENKAADINNSSYQTSHPDYPIMKPGSGISDMSPVNELSDSSQREAKTAGALKKKSRPSREKKQVEVIWEQPAETTNVWFVAVSVILTLFALGIIWTMLYIK